MAIGDPYIVAADLKTWLGISDTDDDTLLLEACKAATAQVDQYCQRQFNKTATASPRYYTSRTSRVVDVHDFHTTTDLVVETDEADDGTWSTLWTSSDYKLRPDAGVSVVGVTGEPYRQIRATRTLRFPTCTLHEPVKVTAQWGWNAVPDAVVTATKMIAARVFITKDTPQGIASFAEGGIIRVRDDVPQALALLERFRHPGRTGVLVG